MAREHTAVRIERDIHQRVKSEASLRGTNLEGAYDEALRNWLEQKAKTPGEILAHEIETVSYYSEGVIRAVNQVTHFAELFGNAIADLKKAIDDARGNKALDELQSIPVVEDATSPIQRATERLVRAREKASEANRRDTTDTTQRLDSDRTADSTKKSDHRRPSRGAA